MSNRNKQKTVETENIVELVNDVVEPEIDNVETEPTEELIVEASSGRVTDCKWLNIRKQPNVNSPVLQKIARGTLVTILEAESTEDFYSIITQDGCEGFCMKKYIVIQ